MLSNEMRADMLLEAANISKAQQQMVISSIGNERDYEKIEAALIFQHPTIEKHETPTRPHQPAKTYSPGGKSTYQRPKHGMQRKKAWVKKTANLADGEQAEVWQEVWLADEEGYPEVPPWPEEDQGEDAPAYLEDSPDCDEDAEAYYTDFVAKASALAEEHQEDIDELEVYELNCYFAAYEETECTSQAWEDKLADLIQTDCEAYFVKGKGKGKGTGGKGKGGKLRGSSMSIEDRRKKLVEVKARTKCRKCGRKGHWQGDKVCPVNSGQKVVRWHECSIAQAQTVLDRLNQADSVPTTPRSSNRPIQRFGSPTPATMKILTGVLTWR